MKSSLAILIIFVTIANSFPQQNNNVDATTNATHLLKMTASNSKISLDPKVLDLSYLSIFLIHIGTYNANGDPSVMATMASNVYNLNPPYFVLNLRRGAVTFQNILNTKAFTLNLPSEEFLVQADYDGHASLKEIEQFHIKDISAVSADSVDAPGVKEFPLFYECTFERLITIEGKELLLCKVHNVKISPNCLVDGKMDLNKVKPILYNHQRAQYFNIGDFIGDLRISRNIYK